MAKTATFYNDFSSTLSPLSTATGSPSLSGGNLVLPAGASVKTTTTDWDLTSSSLVIELASASEADELYFTIGTGAILAPALRWTGGKWNAGISVFAFPGTAASWGNYATSGASANTRKYARLSQSGGTTTYEDSADGVSWSTITTNTGPGSVTAGDISLYNSNGTTTINVATLGVSSAPAAKRRSQFIRPRRALPRTRSRSLIFTGASLITGAPVADPTPVRFNPTMGPPVAFAPTKGAPVRFNPTFSTE